MFIKSLRLKNFKCFEDYSINFEKINLLQGAIGIGKSTIVEAMIFALYGFSESVLSDLPTRGKSTSCSVKLIVEDNGQIVEINRDFPLKLQIKENEKILKLSTSEGNNYLCERFGDRKTMAQFRKIDAYNPESNFLEQGNVVFKKILFAGTDEMFNSIRNNLNAIKLERERLCKDDVVLSTCYPSEKRLEVLNASLKDTINYYKEQEGDILLAEEGLRTSEIKLAENKQKVEYLTKQINNVDIIRSSFDIKLRDSESRINTLKLAIKNCEQKKDELNKQENEVKQTNICYVCKRPLETKSAEDIIQEKNQEKEKQGRQIDTYSDEIYEVENKIVGIKQDIEQEKLQKVEDFKKEIEILEQEEANYIEDIQNTKEIIVQDKKLRDKSLLKKEQIQSLKVRLENRLKQKQFIYTERDVIIVKKAIEELDKMSSVYLVETVRSLEPIINSVLEKIGFQVTFDVDIKGKFNILLIKEDIQYKYTDLSCGQRLILQIALKLSLLLQQNKTGIILSDEGLSALENNNLEDIINLFKDLQFQLIFVLHRASIEDPEINVIKLGGEDEKE